MNGIPVLNMTGFFNRELYLYSLGDISLSKPVSLKKAGFLLAGLIVWTLPLILLFGIHFNILFLALIFAPPVGLAALGDRPVFDGRSVIDAVRVTFRFVFSRKCYTDFNVSDLHTKPEHFVQKEIWISRRRELMALAEIWENNSR